VVPLREPERRQQRVVERQRFAEVADAQIDVAERVQACASCRRPAIRIT
jgi:hypothetical protein